MPVTHGGMRNPYEDAEAREKLDAQLLGVSLQDWRTYLAEHMTIFGHVATPDPIRKVYCNHPLHGQIEHDIKVEGVEIALRHERVSPHTVITTDDEEIDPAYGTKDYIEQAGRPWDGEIREFDGGDR